MSLEMATDLPAGPNEQSLLTATDGNMGGNQGYDDAAGSRLSYFGSVDFAELLACASFLVAGLVLESEGLSPTTRPMPYIQLESSGEYVVNQVFNEEFNGETVSSLELVLFAVMIPAVIQLVISYFVGDIKDFHKSCCVYLAGLGLTGFLTNCIKLYVGYLRPVFFDLCEPDDEYEECTAEDREIRLSFVSGHSSLSFCGLALLSFYLERRLGVSRLRVWVYDSASGRVTMGCQKPPGLARIVSILCYSPMFLAGFISASRIVDNKHHPADIVGGAVLGSSIAVLVHGLWFPTGPIVT